MTLHRPTAWFLATLLTGSLFSQAAADNTTRNLTQEGISFKLPAGWKWQNEVATNIAIQKEVAIKDQTFTVTAELVYQAEAFLEDSLADLEKKVASSKGDLKDLKVTRGEKFNGAPAVLCTLVRVRGDKHDQFEDERKYMFRRNRALYTWTERSDRLVSSQAASALGPARAAVTFTTRDSARDVKTFPDVGVKYAIPADFEHEKADDSLVHVVTAVTVKNQQWLIQCFLTVQKIDKALDEISKNIKDNIHQQFDEVKDFQVQDKQLFRGEKAILVTWSGIQKPKEKDKAEAANPNAPKPTRSRRQTWYFKHKGKLFTFQEIMPEAQNPAIDVALKQARDGATFL